MDADAYDDYTKAMRRSAGAMYLALDYQELAPVRVLVATPNVRAITVLGVAEDITLPLDGVRTQAAFATTIVREWHGVVDAEHVATLSHAEIHALRSPIKVWKEAKTFCHHCAQALGEGCRFQCKACKRAMYCSRECQYL